MVKYQDGLEPVATALANAGRRQILDRLDAGAATTTELAALLGIGLPAVMKQLDVLVDAGIVQRAKHGRTVQHTIVATPLREYATWLTTRRSFWNGQLDALERTVDAHV